ncbi:MAG: LPXTG cell wall anchor domain-containing protein [Bacilli bacterium]|nr:LPXTG cell wall anchor domain-containing protein [Bacilli bacterium]
MNKGIKLLLTILVLGLSFSVVSAKSYSCETVDGAYYGKDGSEVDKVQYDKECATHSCEIVGDTYFGKDGKEVSEETFEAECETTVVSELPDTSSNSDIVSIIAGSLFILGGVVYSISYRKANDRA